MKRYKRASDIKVGVVGYGGAFNMGRVHLQEMEKAGMTPTAVVEIDPTRLAVATQDFQNIETYSSLPAMLKKSAVDFVTIITPHNTHAPLALQALKAGRHVVCEKPMAITTAECDAMIAAAKKSGVVLSTYHNRHWDGPIMNAVQHIGAGMIGDVVRVEARWGSRNKPGDWWRTSKSISGGILYDWGVHLLEYGLQIVRSDIVEVSGFAKKGYWAPQTKWKKDCNEDEAFASVRFKSGQWLTLLISALDSNPRRGFLEITRHGRLVRPRLDRQRIFAPGRERNEDQEVPQPPRRRLPFLPKHLRSPHQGCQIGHHPRVGPPSDPYSGTGWSQCAKRHRHPCQVQVIAVAAALPIPQVVK